MTISRGYPHDRDAAIEQASPGTDVVIAGQAGFRIVVHALFFTLSSAGTLRFRSATGGRNLTGLMEFDAKGGMVVPSGMRGYFATDAGEALVAITTGGAVHGNVSYTLEG